MIHPNMATMIGVIATDAVTLGDLDAVLRRNCDSTFNRVSVDGDTSTNDAVFALASAPPGARGSRRVRVRAPRDLPRTRG